mgnify:FL=1
MGQGLIPAPYAVWKNRRRQLVPGFHKAWLDHMVGLFGDCSVQLTKNLDGAFIFYISAVWAIVMTSCFI